jgi:hypothetical protein
MPTRKTAKRELERAIDNVNWSLHHLNTVLDLGYKNRDDFKIPIENIATTLILAQDCIAKLRDTI